MTSIGPLLTKAPQLPALTAIRGLAAWWVVLYHFREYLILPSSVPLDRLVAHGYLAVDLFFTLSGFIISLNYLRWFERPSLGRWMTFLQLRLARIYPLHIFMLLIFILIPVAITLFSAQKEIGQDLSTTYLVLSIFLIQNWGFTEHLGWNVPAWSISTEFAAYLGFPLLATIVVRLVRTPISALIAIAALLATLAAVFFVAGTSLGGRIPELGLFRCLAQFSIGVCLYRLWLVYPHGPTYAALLAQLGAGMLFLAYATLSLPDYAVFPTAFALLVFSLKDNRTWLARWLIKTPLLILGEVSYSTYMAHYFIKAWTKFLFVSETTPSLVATCVYLAATALSSVVLYHVIEQPARQRARATPATKSVRTCDGQMVVRR